ncbi:MAG: crossover junction endodeoxyribonuclease RuvC [Candidatus Cloacimonadota bacterium]|nr:MAG: crossover junction endodeoxyribonuclease RuvC [Candidatus Cloacimonadota bacterium]
MKTINTAQSLLKNDCHPKNESVHSNSSQKQIIIGIDPGTAITGYGILKVSKQQAIPIKYGVIQTKSNVPLERRIARIYYEMGNLLDEFQPNEAAIEAIFYGRNIKAAFSLGQARGVEILALTIRNIPIFEYSPRKIKQAVVGNGNASKQQVQYMVKKLLHLTNIPSNDSADALAIALAHFHSKKWK